MKTDDSLAGKTNGGPSGNGGRFQDTPILNMPISDTSVPWSMGRFVMDISATAYCEQALDDLQTEGWIMHCGKPAAADRNARDFSVAKNL